MMLDVTGQVAEAGMDADRIHAAIALIADVPPDRLRGFALVMMAVKPDGRPSMRIASSTGDNKHLAAEMLRHGAAHLDSSCVSCTRKSGRRRGLFR